MALFELATYQSTGALWRDKENIEVLARKDLLVVNIEPVSKQNCRALANTVNNTLIKLCLDQVRR
jgi:hypothetical protein